MKITQGMRIPQDEVTTTFGTGLATATDDSGKLWRVTRSWSGSHWVAKELMRESERSQSVISQQHAPLAPTPRGNGCRNCLLGTFLLTGITALAIGILSHYKINIFSKIPNVFTYVLLCSGAVLTLAPALIAFCCHIRSSRSYYTAIN